VYGNAVIHEGAKISGVRRPTIGEKAIVRGGAQVGGKARVLGGVLEGNVSVGGTATIVDGTWSSGELTMGEWSKRWDGGIVAQLTSSTKSFDPARPKGGTIIEAIQNLKGQVEVRMRQKQGGQYVVVEKRRARSLEQVRKAVLELAGMYTGKKHLTYTLNPYGFPYPKKSAARVASRFVRAGLLQPPPKLVEAATRWAQATFADRAYQNAKAKEAEFKRTGAGIIGGQDTLDQWFKAMRSWKRLPSGRRGSEVSTLFNPADYLDGWRYRHLFDDAPEGVEIRPIKVTNAFEHGRPGAHGAWSDKRNELQVWLEADVWMPEVIPKIVEKHDKIIPKTVRHELQHATQRLIGALTEADYGGLPTRAVRQPVSIEEQQRRQREDNATAVTPSLYNQGISPRERERQERYYRSDLEYQTSLTDAVKEWESTVFPPVERWLDETDLSDRHRNEVVRWVLRAYIGEKPRPPRLPVGFKKPDWNPGNPKASVFFERIKGDRKRWQEAVSTFYKEVSRTTRLASTASATSYVPPRDIVEYD